MPSGAVRESSDVKGGDAAESIVVFARETLITG